MAKDALGHGSNTRGGLRKPIPGHPYHAKTDAELRYIIKDASEAAQASQSMGKLETKYNDQVNDAATVLGYRDRGGKSDAPSDQLHSGTPKSAPAPVHDSMSSDPHEYQRQLQGQLSEFTHKYGGPRDHAAEQRAFNKGKREINRLRLKGK